MKISTCLYFGILRVGDVELEDYQEDSLKLKFDIAVNLSDLVQHAMQQQDSSQTELARGKRSSRSIRKFRVRNRIKEHQFGSDFVAI